MRFAFMRGVELLSEQELDSVQSQGQHVKYSPENMEGIGGLGVPKNAVALKTCIDPLMRQVIVITIWPLI
jgi:hypothetical protein